MRRRGPPDDDPVVEAEEEEEEPATVPRSRRTRRRGVRAWGSADRADDEVEPEEEESEDGDGPRRFRLRGGSQEPVYYRARDSIFFEPLVALAIIVVILVGMFAYTQNWPPLYVVESSSMQHGTNDQVGLINTGDLVLAQKVALGSITPYVVGMTRGYSTYGEYGDVLLYNPDGLLGGTPIIHRAIVYLQANPDRTFDAPELVGLPCGSAPNWVFSANSTLGLTGCSTSHITGVLTIRNIGWQSVFIHVDLASVGAASGFVTMGDNNFVNGQGTPDEPILTSLVQPAWIVGVARGMLPWFGGLKLFLSGNAQEVPSQSWAYLGLTVIALVALAIGGHYLLRAEGVEDPRRKEQEAEEESTRRAHNRRRSWRHPLRGWSDEPADEEDPKRSRSRDDDGPTTGRGGRPRPDIGRHPSKRDDADNEDL